MEEQSPAGSFRFMRLFGISVYVHWMWFLLLAWQVQRGFGGYESKVWVLLEFLAIFGIVLVHEFGHALACRSVGGNVRYIVIWLLGGVAFVNPPRRPGAVLWSIAAGPLVNVVLIPILFAAYALSQQRAETLSPDLLQFLYMVFVINIVVLVFNMLPVYPLDGGQILQSLLWYIVGESRSMKIATVIGMVAAMVLGLAAILTGKLFLVLMAAFLGWQAYSGFQFALRLAAHERAGYKE